MNNEKLLAIAFLAGSVVLLLLLIGFMAWHYFHEHHDIHRDSDTGEIPAHISDHEVYRTPRS